MTVEAQDRDVRHAALFTATLGSFLTPFMGSAVNIALPPMGKEFAMEAVGLSWVATAYLLAAAVFLVPFGKIADIHGRKKVYLYGMAVFSVMSILSAAAPSGAWLIAIRAAHGVGAAMIFGTGIAILTSVYPPGDRGRVLGINVAAVYVGLSVGPFAGGFLTEHLGWRSVFILSGVLALAVIAVAAFKLKGEWAGARGDRFDWPGSVIYGVALVSLMLGVSRLPGPTAPALIVPGLVGLVVFVLWELRVKDPVLHMDLFFRNRVFAFSNFAALINYSATFAVGFLLSLYLQEIRGLSPADAGLVLVSQPIVMAAFSPLAGRLSDRIESRVVASAGMAVTVVGLVMLAFLKQDSSMLWVMAGLVVLGFGFALFSSPNTNAVMGSVDRKFLGIASATVGTMRLLGQMLSMGAAMLIFALLVGRVRITAAVAEPFMASMQTAFGLFAAFCFLGVFASLARGKVR